MNNKDDSCGSLAHAKNLGPSRTGSTTWWAQRVSALALIPLVTWFVYFMFKVVKYQNLDELMSVFTSPFPTILLTVFIVTGLYHGNIGIKEIIEDYVHCEFLKLSLIILFNIISLVTAIAAICALLVFHLSTFSFN